MCSQLSYEYSQLCFVVHVLFNRLCLKLLHEHRQLHFATKLQIHNTLRQNYETKTRRAESGQFTATPVSGQTINIQKVAHTRTHISFYIYIYICSCYVSNAFCPWYVSPTSEDTKPHIYHWWELPQASFSSRRNFSRDKTPCLSRQKYACRDKSFVETKLHVFVSRDKFCDDRHTFVVETKDVICRDRHVFVATKLCLSRQKYQAYFFRNKTFVATKIILVAAPANDTYHLLTLSLVQVWITWIRTSRTCLDKAFQPAVPMVNITEFQISIIIVLYVVSGGLPRSELFILPREKTVDFCCCFFFSFLFLADDNDRVDDRVRWRMVGGGNWRGLTAAEVMSVPVFSVLLGLRGNVQEHQSSFQTEASAGRHCACQSRHVSQLLNFQLQYLLCT